MKFYRHVDSDFARHCISRPSCTGFLNRRLIDLNDLLTFPCFYPGQSDLDSSGYDIYHIDINPYSRWCVACHTWSEARCQSHRSRILDQTWTSQYATLTKLALQWFTDTRHPIGRLLMKFDNSKWPMGSQETSSDEMWPMKSLGTATHEKFRMDHVEWFLDSMWKQVWIKVPLEWHATWQEPGNVIRIPGI